MRTNVRFGGPARAGQDLNIPAARAQFWLRLGMTFFLLCQIQALNLIDRELYGEWMAKPGDKFTQLVNVSQIFFGIFIFYKGLRRWQSVRSRALVWLSLAALLIFTATWSVSPGATIRAGVEYAVVIITAIGAAETLDADDFMDLLAHICFFTAVVSIVLMIVWPAAVYNGAHDFRGVFAQKNLLGEAMAMGALACLHGIWAKRPGRAFRFVMLLTTALTAALSASTTSMLTIVLFVGLGTALHKLGMKALLFAIPLALAVMSGPDLMLEMLGKSPTLTGRTDIWTRVIPHIWQSPLFGWGYAAFWTTDNPAAIEISDALGWWVPQAHNGLLEILLSAGLFGAIVYLYLLARLFRLSVICARKIRPALGITCFVNCAGIVVTGVSENVLIYPNAMTVIFLVTAFVCERNVWEARRRLNYPIAADALSLRGFGRMGSNEAPMSVSFPPDFAAPAAKRSSGFR